MNLYQKVINGIRIHLIRQINKIKVTIYIANVKVLKIVNLNK